MSFLFKSSKKGTSGPNPAVPLPQVNRDLRSADGKEVASQIPVPLGNGNNGSKPGSPTPGQNVNNSLNSLTGPDRTVSLSRPVDDRIAVAREDHARSQSPEQKALREGSRETSRDMVCASRDAFGRARQANKHCL